MSVNNEMKIVAFLCNWCSYGGADAAGVARANQPTDLRIIRVPCSGRVNPLFILKALMEGADGVLVSGCHPKDCHYTSGNFYARRRLEALKEFIPILGIDPRRFEYTWVSASEGQRWKEVVTNFTAQIHELGKATKFADVKPSSTLPNELYSPVRPLGMGKNPMLDEMKEKMKNELSELAGIIGWKQGTDNIIAKPAFFTSAEELDELIWGPTNVQSLVGLLQKHKGKKVGIFVKGCDSRAIVALLQENLIKREEVSIFSMQCNGTLDKDKALAKLAEVSGIRKPIIHKVEYAASRATITIKTEEGEKDFVLSMEDVAQDKCRQCTMPSAKVYDHYVGAAAQALDADTRPPVGIKYLHSLSFDERMSFWRGHIERCLHCYACRNACPMCLCKDNCAGDSRNPHWVADDNTPTSKMFFQLIHASHLAGRCSGCAECARACPMGIPVFWLKQQYGGIMKRLFGYAAGLELTGNPPLLGYEVEEANIKEHF